jgi:hypothetical protein
MCLLYGYYMEQKLNLRGMLHLALSDCFRRVRYCPQSRFALLLLNSHFFTEYRTSCSQMSQTAGICVNTTGMDFASVASP